MNAVKRFLSRWKAEYDFKTYITATGSLAVTLLFALYNGFLGIISCLAVARNDLRLLYPAYTPARIDHFRCKKKIRVKHRNPREIQPFLRYPSCF